MERAATVNANIKLLGVEGNLKWEKVGKGCIIELPELTTDSLPCEHAWTIKISKVI